MRSSRLQRKLTCWLKGVGGFVSPSAGCLPRCFKGLANARLQVEDSLLRLSSQAVFRRCKAGVESLCWHVLPSKAEVDNPELCIVHALRTQHKAKLVDLLDLRTSICEREPTERIDPTHFAEVLPLINLLGIFGRRHWFSATCIGAKQYTKSITASACSNRLEYD